MTWQTADGQWRVTAKRLNGQEILQVTTRGKLGWIWRADARTLAEVTQHVPCLDLEEI